MRIAFYKVNRPGLQGLYSRLARWVDGGRYSHVELIFSDGVSASSSFIDGGVRFKSIDYDPEHWDFLDVPAEAELAARKWFLDHMGDGYDLIGTARFVAWFIKHNKRRWFCSEAVAAALGMPEPWRYGPCGLHAALSYAATTTEASRLGEQQ